MAGGGTCKRVPKGRVVLQILHGSEPFSPRDLAASHAAPDARYRVTSVPFLFRMSNLLHRPLSVPPYPSLPSVRGAFDVSNRYRPRRTSDARFPAPWSL
jgi:hypothetical protein